MLSVTIKVSVFIDFGISKLICGRRQLDLSLSSFRCCCFSFNEMR